jgi:hypothetical protein
MRRIRLSLWASILGLVIAGCGGCHKSDEPARERTSNPEPAPAPVSVEPAPAPAAPTSQPVQPAVAASRPKNKAEEIAEKIQTQVEKLRGLEFKQPVKIGVYDKATLKAFLLKHAEKELSDKRLGPYSRGLKALALIPPDLDFRKVFLDVLNEQIAGFYDPDTKELRLIDRSTADTAETKKATGGLEDLARDMMKKQGIDEDAVIMAHELTHALQDQFVGLKSLPMDVEDDDDLVTASQSLIEGDAVLAMMGWMFLKMGQPSKMVFNRSIASGLDQMMDPSSIPGADAVANAPEFIKQGLLFPYIGGLKFCIAIGAKDKSYAAIDQALKAPPLSTEHIIHPEKFAGDATDWPMTVVLPDLSETLGAPRITTNTLGELYTRILFDEKLATPESEKAAAGWDGDRYALYGKPGMVDAVAWASTWDTAEDADQAEAALKSWVAALNPGKESEASDVTSARFSRADGTLDAVARKGQDLFLLRGVPADKLVPVLQKLFEETKKVERKKV